MLDAAITQLKQIHLSIDSRPPLKELTVAQDEVLAHYQSIFSAEALPRLTATDFQSFLIYKNNHHWTGLQRHGPQICKNMDGLRNALIQLHNIAQPVEIRFDAALEEVTHLGKGILSAILLIMYPSEFGVWNQTSEAGLKLLCVWPDFDRGVSPGGRYKIINEVLHQLRDGVGVDLWVLDALLWAVTQNIDNVTLPIDETTPVTEEEVGELQKFGLEKYLHEFLRENWDATELGKNWEIYHEAGEDAGYKYPCGLVGQIDILARHKNGRDWLVVELKRDKSGDATVGQLLRYMGFIKHSLAKEIDNKVFGLIVARTLDLKLQYAVSTLPNVAIHTYAVGFKLGSAVKANQSLPFKLPTLHDLLAAV